MGIINGESLFYSRFAAPTSTEWAAAMAMDQYFANLVSVYLEVRTTDEQNMAAVRRWFQIWVIKMKL